MIVSCGEALVDLIAEGAGEDVVYRPKPGGSPFNTALALARLGAPTAFLGRMSEDGFGRTLAAALAADGVDLSLLVRGAEPTTLAFVSKVNGQPSYAFYTQGTADRVLAPAELPPLPDGAAILHWGLGAVTLGGASVAETLLDLFRREAGRRLLSFDPNIRPAMIPDLAAYGGRVAAALAPFDLVKVSAEDLELLDPGRTPDAVAADWLGRGPKAVVVTRGGDGATVYRPGSRREVPAAPVAKLADTVGAGDSFTAGLLTALHERGVRDGRALAALSDDELADCALFAGRVAAKTCERVGCNPPRRGELG
ncbi:MAG TPA: carbohydrate kinase [Alphaproteobacteria bacterium]|nr:carbohydrate kinase [Alphaproteobacteria bacterium]